MPIIDVPLDDQPDFCAGGNSDSGSRTVTIRMKVNGNVVHSSSWSHKDDYEARVTLPLHYLFFLRQQDMVTFEAVTHGRYMINSNSTLGVVRMNQFG